MSELTGAAPQVAPAPPATAADEALYLASGWRLTWIRFGRHRLGVASTAVVLLFYLVAMFAEFFAVHDPHQQDGKKTFVPPQPIHFDGLRPYVHEPVGERNPVSFALTYSEDSSTRFYLRLFARGFDYRLLGLVPTDMHLLGVTGGRQDRPIPLYLLGTDRMGRDLFSRLMFGTRLSMSIGLVGVFLSLFLGVLLGGLSGYLGGWVDALVQRLIEFLRSIPTIPLWLALAAAVPQAWGVVQTYFAITVILSIIGWTGLARQVRGRFLALRQEDYVLASTVSGSSTLRTIYRHMVPNFISHLIVTTTLAVPSMILAETSLSFLGLGLRPPAISWGVLLFEAQNLHAVAAAPWLLIPGIFVFVTIVAFNFMGDGFRDAADPYAAVRKQ